MVYGVRTGHPTLKPGPQAMLIVERFEKLLLPPQHEEGFAAVLTAEHSADAEASLLTVSRRVP
jgi:hypothetical protein